MTRCMLETLKEASIERQKEWSPNGPTSILFKATEIAGEVGELCNVIKKISREEMGAVGSRSTLDDVADELADVIICADLISTHLDINLSDAIKRKFNKTSEKYGLQTKINSDDQLQQMISDFRKRVFNSGRFGIEKRPDGFFLGENYNFKVGIDLNASPNCIVISIYGRMSQQYIDSASFTKSHTVEDMLTYIRVC